jgi:AcrR family transcriptional regulator
MPDGSTHIEDLRREIYDAQQAAHQLERRLAEAEDDADPAALAAQLVAAQAKVVAAEQQLAAARKQADTVEQVTEHSSEETRTRGLATTGLKIVVEPQMANVPTAIYHLLNAGDHPLVKCTLTTTAAFKRVRVTSYIEGYSAKAIDTVEIKRNQNPPAVVCQQPTLFPDKIASVHELTRASLNILGEDLDTGKIEVHKTIPIWLLARTSAPLATYRPADGVWEDMSRYLGAFVTPNQPEVMRFLRTVAARHADMRLVGYQDDADVDAQVAAIFEALKNEGEIVYVNSVRDFNPDTGVKSQRLRLPAESLRDRQANCVDGAVLFAALLEALTLNPALVVLPSHVIVAWESKPASDQWQYLDTTKLDTRNFAQAVKFGSGLAKAMESKALETGDPEWFRRWPLRELRGTYGIYPTE